MERRLSAIFAADMVGFSRLMETDEVGTLERQKNHRKQLIDPTIEKYHGSLFKEMGDGILVEFPSAVQAVQCAVEIQRSMPDRESEIDEDHKIVYRIGINLGDVIVEQGDLYGDGVNIAARLEQLADEGGICISGTTYDHLKSQVAAGYQPLGEVQVKNISRPVRAYKVLIDPEQMGKTASEQRPHQFQMTAKFAGIIAFVLAMLTAGGALWWSFLPDFEPADQRKFAFKLPKQPSIAVLPLAVQSGAGNLEVFGDGIARDIATDLSKYSDILVISSDSAFSYKNQETSIQNIAEELGVRYILKGSVRQSQSDLRINIELSDAVTGIQVWADRFDRKPDDIFAVQDEISKKVVSLLGAHEGAIAEATVSLAIRKHPSDLSVYELVVLARKARNKFTEADNRRSEEMLHKAAEIDPNFARIYVGLAWTHIQDLTNRWTPDPRNSAKKALLAAQRAIELDPTLAEAHAVSGQVYLFVLGQSEPGVSAYRRALSLNPNDADTLALWGGWVISGVLGESQDGIQAVKRAMRLSPFHGIWYKEGLVNAYSVAGEHENAVKVYRSIQNPPRKTQLVGIASLSHSNRVKEAKAEAAIFLESYPDFSVSEYAQNSRGLSVVKPEFKNQLLDGLRLAGLP